SCLCFTLRSPRPILFPYTTLFRSLLDILACPAEDHAPLRPGTPEQPGADVLSCTSCGRVYPVRDGIPVLLLDEAVDPDSAHQVRSEEHTSELQSRFELVCRLLLEN